MSGLKARVPTPYTCRVNTDVPKRVALYARASTKQHGHAPETQLLPLRDHAAHKGHIVCEEYVDVGISGSKERLAFGVLLAAL